MLLGFIRRLVRTTKNHAPNQQRHLRATGIGSSNFRSSCSLGLFGFLTSIFVPQLRQRSVLSSFSQPQPWQTFIKSLCRFQVPRAGRIDGVGQEYRLLGDVGFHPQPSVFLRLPKGDVVGLADLCRPIGFTFHKV